MATNSSARCNRVALAVQAAVAACCGETVLAQEAQTPAAPTAQQVQEVIVTGSRIEQNVAQSTQPISVISSAQIDKTGLASVGELLSQLPTTGAALNTKFNSSGKRIVRENLPKRRSRR